MPENATCVYCLEPKDTSHFNREHVVPESFGKFEHNHVLSNRVCTSCNSYFSRNLELTLGRETYEGIQRVALGVASAKPGRKIARELIQIRHNGGRHAGALMRYRGGTDMLEPIPQLGFAIDPDGPFEWFPVEQLPSKETLESKGYRTPFVHMQSGGLSKEEALRYIQAIGFSVDSLHDSPQELDAAGTIPARFEGRVTTTVLRAVAKIAFNYLTYFYPRVAPMDQFGGLRRFVRYGEPRMPCPVTVSSARILPQVPSNRRLLAHIVTLAWDKKERVVIGQVSLFSWLTYRVALSEGEFLVPPEFICSGHIYDPLNRRIAQLTNRPPAGASPQIPMVSFAEHPRRER